MDLLIPDISYIIAHMALSCVLAFVGTSLRLTFAVVWITAPGLFSAEFYSLVWVDHTCVQSRGWTFSHFPRRF